MRQETKVDSGTIASLFDLTIAGETATRDFYEGLSGMFAHEANISRFWNNMAADASEQTRMLQDLRNALTSRQLSETADQDIFMTALENSRVQVSEVLAMVRSLNDAYTLAQLWENSELWRVIEFLIEKFIPTSADRRFVRLHITTHRNKLAAFYRAFGDVEERKKIEARNLVPPQTKRTEN